MEVGAGLWLEPLTQILWEAGAGASQCHDQPGLFSDLGRICCNIFLKTVGEGRLLSWGSAMPPPLVQVSVLEIGTHLE